MSHEQDRNDLALILGAPNLDDDTAPSPTEKNRALRAWLVRAICAPRIIPQSLFEEAGRLAQRRIDEDATKTQGRAPGWLISHWQHIAAGVPPFGYIVLSDPEYRRTAADHAQFLGSL